jgi:sporulation protein YlmC with PRC-barrel domain
LSRGTTRCAVCPILTSLSEKRNAHDDSRHDPGAALLSSSALAQTTTPPPAKDAPAAAEVNAKGAHWRSSKLIGVNVYNEQNEKLGDINEIILDPSGKVMGYVIGVGGFLGMGEHDPGRADQDQVCKRAGPRDLECSGDQHQCSGAMHECADQHAQRQQHHQRTW